MFGWWYASSIAEAVGKMPKEVVGGIVAAYVVLEIHRRNTNVKIAEAETKLHIAKLEVETLRLKRDLQRNASASNN